MLSNGYCSELSSLLGESYKNKSIMVSIFISQYENNNCSGITRCKCYLINQLPQYIQGSIIISIPCDYDIMDQGGIWKGSVGQKLLSLLGICKTNIKIMGGGVSLMRGD